MNDRDLAKLLNKLPQLHAKLQAKGMDCGPDTWLAVHDLLLNLGRKRRLPDDPLDLAPFIGPILCNTPEHQREFPGLFEEWWTGRAPPPTAILGSEGQIQHRREQARTQRVDRHWRWALAAIVLLLALLASAIALWPPEKTDAPPKAPPRTQPKFTSTPPPEQATKIPISDWAPPNRLPEPQRVPVEWEPWLDRIGLGVPWVPAVPILALLAWLYRRRWVLSKGDPDSDALAERLRLRLPQPLFGGEHTLGPLQRLRAGAWVPTRKLDMNATVEASARQAGYFEPRYLTWRSSPHYLVLVRSRHTHDQGAALADELIGRLKEHGLSVDGFRFRDDPSWLVPWSRPQQPSRSLARLAREWPDARLIVVSEGDILYHPLTGRTRPWLERIESWKRRAWLGSGPMDAALTDWLWERDFLVLPLTGGSLEPLSHWLAGRVPKARVRPGATVEPRPLPRSLNLLPERWLDSVPPYGESLPELLTALKSYLGSDGWLLLQAVAAYPQARWPLTQALDFLLFEQDDTSRREERLGHLGRLPWVRYGHLPDYLRETLLEGLDAKERRRVRDAYGKLLDLPTPKDGPGVLTLPIAAPTRRKLRRLLLDSLFARRRPSTLDDPIFLNLLLGDPLSLLDFRLPRALARLLPGGRWRLNPWPGLGLLLLAAGLGYGLAMGWERGGKTALISFWNRRLDAENALWPVRLRYGKDTEALADAMNKTLAAHRFSIRTDGAAADAKTPRNRIVYPPGAETAAQRLARHLRHATYGAAVDLHEDPAVDGLVVDLARTYGDSRHDAASIFNDTMAYSDEPGAAGQVFRDRLKDGGEGPAMVVIPAGTFEMGSPDTEVDRSSDEGPRRVVTIARSFALGRYEITFDEYDRFAKATGRELPRDSGWGRGNRPVIEVTWDDATAYAEWLSQQTGKAYRLPTEEEWEYAARAGTSTPYWWGSDIGKNRANCYGCGSEWDGKQTAPVGSFPANGFGLHDTAGNVFEWTADCWHEDYRNAPADGSAWLDADDGDCTGRVVRGGSWGYDPQYLRSACRNWIRAGEAGGYQGFRLARDL